MKKNIIKTFTFMFSAMFLAKILGLVRNIVFANLYGTGMESVAFFTASRIPLQLLDMSLGAAISSTFIPVFNEYLTKDGKKRAVEFAANFLNVIILLSTVLTLLGILFAPQIVSIISPDLEADTFALTVKLITILFPMMIFTAIAFVFVGFLQSMDEFNIPAIISVVANAIVIIYMLFFNQKFGIHGMAISMLLGWSTQMLVQIPSLVKHGFKPSFRINFKDEGLKKVAMLAIPIFISTWVQPINNLVNLRLASGLEEGQAISAIEYSYGLYLIIVGVFSYTLSNIIFPQLSKLSTEKDMKNISKMVNQSLKVSALFIIPMSVGIGLLSKEIIELIYERGEFTAHSTMLTSGALTFYAIGMIGYGLMELFNKVFYAMQDTKTPMKISALAIALNVVGSIIFVRMIGYRGLPLAASLTSLMIASIMLKVVHDKVGGIVDKQCFHELLEVILASAIMGVVVILLKAVLPDITLLKIATCIFAGIIVYFAVIIITKMEIVNDFIKGKIKKNG